MSTLMNPINVAHVVMVMGLSTAYEKTIHDHITTPKER